MSPRTKNILVGAVIGFMLAVSLPLVVLFLDTAPEVNAYIFGERYKLFATFTEAICLIGAIFGAALAAADD
ncbi:hypothetical protein LG047_15650 [Methylocystis sp. WRRC1]|uniref:hypothetical protein n=1 Tax=Methylocystis sp. WRRC1 TaxID=1732014 RepID=UPI001D146DDE|nr:hypothetical protein [Methylocystis sp. WRRC1]MCC3246735.1 hypothetical protein [Methylocystis sp. WRRC1]